MKILLVEDNPAHAELISQAISRGSTPAFLDHVSDGASAIDYIYRRERYESAKEPDLIILDLRLPKIDGLGVLKTIKSDENLKKTPVVILSTSSSRDDVAEAYSSYANCYLVKPAAFEDLIVLMNEAMHLWQSAG